MSTEPKMTPWFRDGQKPAREGGYQQMSGSGAYLGYQRWDGRHWHAWCESADAAAKVVSGPVPQEYQNDPWRGLASKP